MLTHCMLVPFSLRQVRCTGTPVSIGWFEVLEVLEGERCLDHCVSDYHPSRDVGFLVCLPVGFLVNTVVTSGGSTIL